MKVNCTVLHSEVPILPELQHVREALEALGFKLQLKEVDLIGETIRYFEIPERTVCLGNSDTLFIGDIAEKLEVFQSVPVTTSYDSVIFTIEDYFG